MKKTSGKKILLFKGLVLAMLSGMFFSTAAVIVKHIKSIQPDQLAVYRFIAIFSFSMPEAVKSGENLIGPEGFRVLLVLRGLFGATNILFSFYAFRYLPLGDASVIIFSVPIFVTVAARIFLKEKIGILQSIAILFTVIGIILTTKLPLQFYGKIAISKTNMIGYLCAIGSLSFNTARYVIMRKVKSVHHAITVFTSAWTALIETVIVTLVIGHFQQNHCGIENFYIILLGLFSYSGQTLLTMALQYEQAGPVSTMRAAIDISLGFLWQMFLFDDIPDGLSISGAVLVLMSVLFLGLKKWVLTLPQESVYFKRLKFIIV